MKTETIVKCDYCGKHVDADKAGWTPLIIRCDQCANDQRKEEVEIETFKVFDSIGTQYRVTKHTNYDPYILEFINFFGVAFFEGEFNTIEEIMAHIIKEEEKLTK